MIGESVMVHANGAIDFHHDKVADDQNACRPSDFGDCHDLDPTLAATDA